MKERSKKKRDNENGEEQIDWERRKEQRNVKEKRITKKPKEVIQQELSRINKDK